MHVGGGREGGIWGGRREGGGREGGREGHKEGGEGGRREEGRVDFRDWNSNESCSDVVSASVSH